MEPVNDGPSISCLPDEIIVMILQQNDYRDIIHFSATCKRFNELVRYSHVLWKNTYKNILPKMLETMQRHGTSDWYKEVRGYYVLKKAVYAVLSEASEKYYYKLQSVHFSDICVDMNVYSMAASENLYCVVTILQNMIKDTLTILNGNATSPPHTLTEMYYAKVTLRYYFHAYLGLKWTILCSQMDNPPPVAVITFFAQWIYNTDLEADNIADAKISELANKVNDYLKVKTKGHSAIDPAARKVHKLSDQDVLMAVSHVLYKQRHLVLGTDTADFDTLDISKVLKNKCGHHIVLQAIYQAVASKFGVVCELHVFPNHVYMEYRHDWHDPVAREFTVDVKTGTLKPKGGCPFSRNPLNTFRYDHNILIECLYMEYHRTMGYINDWSTQNSFHLTEFLRMNDDDSSPYRQMPDFLLSHPDFPLARSTPLQVKYLSPIHLCLLNEIFNRNSDVQLFYREKTVNRHPSCIQYAVGMICTHKTTQFKCVILGWDTGESYQSQAPRLRYFVIDMDKSTRYVDQEHLIDLKQPTRLTHLEDSLAPEFSHFDGFRYVPNANKRAEYPDDDAIALMYKSRAGM
ncbi:uncharacterized protein LOC128682011 isoform X2 [Plodia interpunctella]|uniref:uncharacterized protein LOC128682011 isoform X2 n=1 Tax=Plodia interpunctella TaxID=58824 RepID=UPI0023679003|nr:uncharacterized protein LOC128682011 isoform X2 [Plodia interpunctella]